MSATATQLRERGNRYYAKFKEEWNGEMEMIHLHRAIDCYKQSIHESDHNDSDSKASAYKNMGVCYAALAPRETRPATELTYWKYASYARAKALEYGEIACKNKVWKNEIMNDLKATVERYITTSTGLVEDILQEVLETINVNAKWRDYHVMMCRHRLDQGERILNKCMEAVGDRDYEKALPTLKSLYYPIEEAKKHTRRNRAEAYLYERLFDETIRNLEREVATLEEETSSFIHLAEGLRSYNRGIAALEKMNKTGNGLIRTEHAFAALDYFKEAELLSRGADVELVAMSQTQIGMTFLNAFNLKARAKLCFLEAMEVAMTVVGNVHNRPWFIKLKDTMEKLRQEEIDLEASKWENIRKPYLEELKTELAQLESIKDKPTAEMIDFIWEKFPPKNKKVIKPTVEEGKEKKPLLKMNLFYHPDKIDAEIVGMKYKVLCEEITKIINRRYNALKELD